MQIKELKSLFDKLSIEDKINQTIQLNGDKFVNSGVMNTGPKRELGLPEDLNLYNIGSIYNVNDPEKLKSLQKEVLSKSKNKIPMLFMSDIIYGFRTIFPMPLAQAGSYDFDLIKKSAAVSAKESYLNGIHVVFSPMLDIARDPRWGRVMESPGEDVYTAKEFAKSVVKGYQGDDTTDTIASNHVAACIKHFAAYGAVESGKEYNEVDMSNQKLFNEYLQPYKAAVEANTQMIMTAFNLLNGVPATGNEWLNRKILRERFGFNGVLGSDHGAISELVTHGYAKNSEDAARKAIEAGVDFDMMTSIYANALPNLVKDDKFKSLVEEAAWRILVLKNKLGLFENPYRGLDKPNTGEILTEESRQTAVKLVEESCVLLKNNGSLPISNDKKIAVIGPYGTSKLTLGFWASVSGRPTDVIPLKDGLEKHFSKSKLSFNNGYNLFDSYDSFGPFKTALEQLNGPIENDEKLLREAISNAEKSDVVVITFGENFVESGEGSSKAHLKIPEKQRKLIKAIAKLGKPMIGLVYTGRPLVLTDVDDYFDSLMIVWYPGIMGGIGIANLLAGKANPSARLSITFPRSEGQIPIYKAHTPTGRPLTDKNGHDRFVSKYVDEKNEPLYDFGSGLSYSRITGTWNNINYSDSKIKGQFIIKNESKLFASTTAHIYLMQKPSDVVRPVEQLVKSIRVELDGETNKNVNIEIDKNDLIYFDNNGNEHLDNGEYKFELDILGEKSICSISI